MIFSRIGRTVRHPVLLVATTAAVLVAGEVSARSDKAALSPFNRYASLSGSYLAGRFAAAAHDADSASTYLQTTLAFDPGNPVISDRTFPLLVASGRLGEAFVLAEQIVQRDKGNALARIALAADAVKKARFSAARQHLQAVKQRPLIDLTTAVMMAWAQQAQGDTDAALKTIDKVSGEPWYATFKGLHSALIADAAGRRGDALKFLKAAYAVDPTVQRIADAYGRALARSGAKAEALAIYDAYDKVLPEHPVMMASRAEIDAGKPIGLLTADPAAGIAEFLQALGGLLSRDGGEEFAGVYLQLALHLDPNSQMALLSLGTLYGKMRDFDRAIDTLSRIDETGIMGRNARLQIARYYNFLQKPEDARREISRLVERDSKDVDAALALGDVLRNEKRYDEAAEAYTKALALIGTPTRKDWSVFYYRGMTLERAKKWDQAEPDFLKALELNPDEADVLNYLGYSWVDMGVNLDRGLDMVKKAVELQPRNGFIIDSLGWAYYRLGRYEEAVEQLEKAVSLRAEDPTLNDHLGDAYWKVGRRLEARFQWNHARDLKPDVADLPRILDKIRDGLTDDILPAAAKVEIPPLPEPVIVDKPPVPGVQ